MNPQIGETLPGPNIYTNLGDIPRSGPFGLSLANNDTSHRDNVSFPCDQCARETTWFFIPGTGGGGGINSETTNFILKIVFVVLAIVILYVLIQRHPKFIEWLKGLVQQLELLYQALMYIKL
jgi:hypothetical protein